MLLPRTSIAVEADVPQRSGLSRRWLRVALLFATAVVLAWWGRRVVLAGMGRLLVREDPLQPAEVIVVSTADLVGDTIEAGRLYLAGVSTEIVLLSAPSDPVEQEIRKLGGLGWTPAEYASWLLKQSGVPSSAVTVLPNVVDGTNAEIRELAAFAERRQPTSLVYIISRTHTARAARLLGGALPARTYLMVTSPRTDTFNANSWWQSREQTRALVTEYIRWVNTFVLRDLWGR